jgi:protein-L-isoaspartate(D-aspartate) O-methyltransferase
VPQPLLALLETGGRLIGIVGQEPAMRVSLFQRTGENTWDEAQPWDCEAPHCRARSQSRC